MGDQAPTKDNRLAEAELLYEVRLMTEDDIPQVCHLEKLSFAQPWSEFAFRSELADNKLAYYAVLVPKEEPEKVVGYGGLWIILDEAHITNIAVLPEYRGKRLGHLLVATLQDLARLKGAVRMTLEVRVSNDSAIRLYERLGFKEEGIRRHYYTDNNEDASIMWCQLTEQEEKQ